MSGTKVKFPLDLSNRMKKKQPLLYALGKKCNSTNHLYYRAEHFDVGKHIAIQRHIHSCPSVLSL